MAAIILDAWSTPIFSADPTGSLTISAGSNRCLIVAQQAERNSYSVSTFTVGGQSYTYQYEVIETSTAPDLIGRFFIWNEAAIAAMSGSAISYTDTVAVPGKFAWSYAVLQNVLQTSLGADQFDTAFNASTDALDVTTTSTANDYVVVSSTRLAASRDITNWDTLTEVYDSTDSNSFYRASLGAGAGGDNTTTVTGDGTADEMLLISFVALDSAGTEPVVVSSISDFDIVFKGQKRVDLLGTGFGASQGTGDVYINNVASLDGNEESQTINSWSDTSINIDVSTTHTSGTLYLLVSNNGAASTHSLAITVKDQPSGAPVEVKSVATQNIDLNVAYSIDMSTYQYDHEAQLDDLTLSIAGLPSGLSLNTTTEVIEGVIDEGENTSSPFTVDLTATDLDSNSVVDQFSWTVSDQGTSGTSDDRRGIRQRPYICRLFGRR